jgi:hypothetical protein
MGDYIVTGNSKENGRCLVFVIGRCSLEEAEIELNIMKTNPTDQHKRLMKDLTDFEIKYVEPKDCWWIDC